MNDFAPNWNDRFWSKVRVDTERGCWLWSAGLNTKGYGSFRTGSHTDGSRRTAVAHRHAWELAIGPVTDGSHVLHRCDVRGCVNPAHLFLGTNADNMADMVAKGRQSRGEAIAARMRGDRNPARRMPERMSRGETSRYAKLTEVQVLAIRGDLRAQDSVAAEHGVSVATVSRVKSRKTWSHVL